MCVQDEYPNYTPLLAKILDAVVSGGAEDDKISYKQEVSLC